MTHYIGVDLGTTNSVISSYDGENLKIYNSLDQQSSVTPSAIYIDKRSKFYGFRAYQMSAKSPDNVAILFKRLMGTSTPIPIKALGISMTPEQCSAEVLKLLYSYLPEEIRNNTTAGTVITVPAAFNQMQKDATNSAAEMAGIGRVALMQEPVAAVMSVMKVRKADGRFLIYDLGGGTLDIALAESITGRVSLLEHGGIAMNGGRDWDRLIVDGVIKPWLLENFDLPEDFPERPRYQSMLRLANYYSEQAKISLSSRLNSSSAHNERVSVYVADTEIRTSDESGKEIYIDLELDRETLDRLIEGHVRESVTAARDVLGKAHLSAQDIERIVFVGGPTQYKPLRERVSQELGIPGTTDVNPMTAVAEGAALFAESIDWSTANRARKSTRGTISGGGRLDVAFNYQARTPDVKSRMVIQARGKVLPGTSFQIDSLDSGWSSGRMELKDGAAVTLTLSKNGENRFKIFVFDPAGSPISLPQETIVITRTTATVDAIPASHSVGIAAKEKMGGQAGIDYLVRAGDPLPKKGQKKFRTEESLRAGGPGEITFNLWEGEIDAPFTDNRPIGTFKITGADFDEGVIPAGAELICDYEMTDAGNLALTVTVPSVQGTFSPHHNFYSRQEGQIDYTNASKQIMAESDDTLTRLDQIAEKVKDESLAQARMKLEDAKTLGSNSGDPENCKKGMDNILEAKQLLSKVRKTHLKTIRSIELQELEKIFNEVIRQHATSTEITSFENMTRAAERAIEQNANDFEGLVDQIRSLNWQILWRQDWFVVETFKRIGDEDYLFTDKARRLQLLEAGMQAIKSDNIEHLRQIVATLYSIRIATGGNTDTMDVVNILRD